LLRYGKKLSEVAEQRSVTKPFAEIDYTVTVFTGDKVWAGTDANVFVTMTGEFGDSGERELRDSGNVNKFEKNQEDAFTVTAVELGRLKKLKIRHDNKGGGAAWYLDRVEVEDPKNSKKFVVYFANVQMKCIAWWSTARDPAK